MIEGCNLFRETVWVGRFPLTMTVEGFPPEHEPNLSYYICWKEWEVERRQQRKIPDGRGPWKLTIKLQ